jgi:hypothetical protein
MKAAKVELNPDNLERTIPYGPLENESLFDFHFRALKKYKKLHGDMLVPKLFRIPWSMEWPEEMWGLGLGMTVQNGRRGRLKAWIPHRKELEDEGFVFKGARERFLEEYSAQKWSNARAGLLVGTSSSS